MGQRGRTSGAALSVVAGSIDGRPKAPEDLTDFQGKVWDKVVASEPADFFRSAVSQQLLKEYCRHVQSAHALGSLISVMEEMPVEDWGAKHMEAWEGALKMRDRETKALADKATKLRLTNQSRYTPQAAGTAAKKAATELKPWQMQA
jgi:hypothetical protein